MLAKKKFHAVILPFIACAVGLLAADDRRPFWSYDPPSRVSPPQPANELWPRGAVDRFILARMEQAGIKPSADADRSTLVRRIYFDLIGLPPTTEQIDEFLNDRSSEAVATLIDRLLDSEHFGERWGRHWMDVARYADSSGGGRSLLFSNAWRYRDYVIESLNRDKPFDQFIREQIAGDLLPFESDAQRAEQLIATTFLMIGAHNYELQDKEQLRMDVVDEQIEAVGRAFLGQTLGCARCHDHKFDPIPTTDYYALAGIFRSTKSLTPGNVSGFEQHELPVSPERRAALDEHASAVIALQQRLDLAKNNLKKLQAETKTIATNDNPIGIVVDDAQATVVGNWTKSKYNSGYLGEGYIHDGASGKGEKSVTFQVDLPHDGEYEVRVSYTHGTNRSPSVPVTVRHQDDQETVQIDERQPPPIDGRFVALGRWRFHKGTSDAVVISNEGTTGHVIVDAVQFVPVELLAGKSKDTLRSDGPDGVSANANAAESERKSEDSVQAKDEKKLAAQVKQLENDLKKLKASGPTPAPLTMGVKDEKEPGDFRICIRGIVHNLGDPVRRGFMSAAAGRGTEPPVIAADESGRRELADWLASPSNPLTARVAVNRIWTHLFGVGLVRTTDNFGSTGEAPSHPELVDWLALRFIELGWSHKKLIREIVLSRTYQMSSGHETANHDGAISGAGAPPNKHSNSESNASRLDPDNRLLWRQNRKRLDAECLRDSLLSISGQLDLTLGGAAMRDKTDSEYGYSFDSRRRSVYLPVFRNNLPDIFEVFDFADPNTPTGRRNVSTLPSQALYLMNSPFVMDAARQSAEDILELDLPDPDRIDLAYRRTVGRLPSDTERDLAIRYLQELRLVKPADPAAQRLQTWTRFHQALFGSLDFRYLY